MRAHEELRRSKDLAGRVSGGGPIERLPPWRFRPIGVHVQRNTHRSGSRWRRSRGNGDAVADQDRVVADDHLFDEEPHDPLPLQDIKGLGRRPQACQERRSCTSSGSAPCDGVRQGGASHFRCRIPRDTTLVNDVVSCRANSDCRRVPSIRSRPSPHGARRVPDLDLPTPFAAIVSESRYLFSLEPQEAQSLVPFGEIARLFKKGPTPFPVAEPHVGVDSRPGGCRTCSRAL